MRLLFRCAARASICGLLIMLLCPDLPSQSRRRTLPETQVRAADLRQPAAMKVRVDEGLVTVDIRFTPLQEVLREFADWTGVVFEIESQENSPVSLRLQGLPVEDAIRRITGDANTLVYYEPGEGGPRVSFVRVFPRTRRNANPSILYIGSGAVTKTEADAVDSPEQALAVLEGSEDVEARQRAVEVLVEAQHSSAAGALAGALEDPAAEVRAAAIEGLAGLGARQALAGISKALKDPNPGVRQSAIEAISLLGDATSVRDLMPLLRDKDASVAAAAEMAVRKLAARAP
ncbi:MAG: HEAT repeat domain-containing protein [Acidobacteria bacterium]|nr:HEAT repeat domain-containing protein [Acidobacteriota bacterium]